MKILIVEDDLVNRTILIEVLSEYGICHSAGNGAEGVEAFQLSLDQKTPYDLICLDIMMPVMDGQEALERIRELEKKNGIWGSGQTKIIMTTALKDPKNIMQALIKGGCEAYLTKPLKIEELKEQIKQFGLID
jgi:two-component system, chemotaxis family, chemotaxis protein CheY